MTRKRYARPQLTRDFCPEEFTQVPQVYPLLLLAQALEPPHALIRRLVLQVACYARALGRGMADLPEGSHITPELANLPEYAEPKESLAVRPISDLAGRFASINNTCAGCYDALMGGERDDVVEKLRALLGTLQVEEWGNERGVT